MDRVSPPDNKVLTGLLGRLCGEQAPGMAIGTDQKLASRIEWEANLADEHFTRDPAGLLVSKVRSRFDSDDSNLS